MYNRRHFLKTLGLTSTISLVSRGVPVFGQSEKKPNIILCMSDDQGWGDTGYNGHPFLQTPKLDQMAKEGLVFDRFYSGAPVCSPTRASCLTGRHPYRMGIFHANVGHMKSQELTLAEVLKTRGYHTGHFGKWHLGTLTKLVKDSNRGGQSKNWQHYSPPWDNGFDVCFSTEAKVPTWDPMITPDESAQGGRKNSSGEPYGTYYWTGPGQLAVENLSGDDSRVIMDRAIPFIRQAAGRDNPFFAVIWFHTPHLPVLTGKKYRDMYPDRSSDEQHYYGCITAMDEQVGRLRKELAELGIEDHTLLWYCADNGPEGKEPQGRTQGRTKGLRGRKRDLYEGGIRVPGLLVWPDKIKKQRHITMPCSTSDYYPTVLDVLNIEMPNQPRPIDGTSLVPLLEGKMTKRPYPIAFETRHGDKKPLALVDNRYKLYSPDDGNTFELYDIINDPSETTDLADQNPEKVRQLKTILLQWRASCEQSLAGKDYF